MGAVHALGNIRALLVVCHEHCAALVINAVLRVVVTNRLDRVSGHLDVVHIGTRGDLAGQHNKTGVAEGLCSHARLGILRKDCV